MKIKRVLSIGLVVAMLAFVVGALPSAAAGDNTTGGSGSGQSVQASGGQNLGSARIKNKDEVVYASLSAEGKVSGIYTVNHFEVEEKGTVVDHGNYESVVNLTDTGELDKNGETVSFTADKGNYYYQGNMVSNDLPWNFSIEYTLDGRKVSAAELAGKSGKLEIHITSSRNGSADSTFYDNYMLQISATLDTDKCTNITAPDGTPATAGKNRVTSFTVLPGGDADFTLSADVRDFTMPGIEIAAVPYSMSMDFPDTDDALGGLEQLPEAVARLNEGVGELDRGVAQMNSGADELASGSAAIESGLSQLGGNSGLMKDASAQINDALAQIAAGLNGSGDIDMSKIAQLPAGLTALADGLRDMANGLDQLSGGYAQAYGYLQQAMQGLASVPLTPQEVADLENTDISSLPTAQQTTIVKLIANYRASQGVQQAFTGAQQAFNAVNTTLPTTSAAARTMAGSLDTIAAEVTNAMGSLSGLEQLLPGLAELAANYSAFHEGLVGYMDGVSTLSANYAQFNAGVAALSEGVGELSAGVSELYDGTTTFNNEISGMPQLIQDEIDKMKEQYMPSDFEPVSFSSADNTDTSFVQFVLTCEGVEKPDDGGTAVEETKELTLWDRLVALFQ